MCFLTRKSELDTYKTTAFMSTESNTPPYVIGEGPDIRFILGKCLLGYVCELAPKRKGCGGERPTPPFLVHIVSLIFEISWVH